MLFEDFSYEDKFSCDYFHASEITPGKKKRSTWLLSNFKQNYEFLGKVAKCEMPLEVEFTNTVCHSEEKPSTKDIQIRFFLKEFTSYNGVNEQSNGQRHNSLWISAPYKELKQPLCLEVRVIRNDPKDSRTLDFFKKNVVLTEDQPAIEVNRKLLHVANWISRRQEWISVNDGLVETVVLKLTVKEMVVVGHTCDILSEKKTKPESEQ